MSKGLKAFLWIVAIVIIGGATLYAQNRAKGRTAERVEAALAAEQAIFEADIKAWVQDKDPSLNAPAQLKLAENESRVARTFVQMYFASLNADEVDAAGKRIYGIMGTRAIPLMLAYANSQSEPVVVKERAKAWYARYNDGAWMERTESLEVKAQQAKATADDHDNRIKAIDAKADATNTEVTALGGRVGKVEAQTTAAHAAIKATDVRVDKLDATVRGTSAAAEDLKKRAEAAQAVADDLKKRAAALEADNNQTKIWTAGAGKRIDAVDAKVDVAVKDLGKKVNDADAKATTALKATATTTTVAPPTSTTLVAPPTTVAPTTTLAPATVPVPSATPTTTVPAGVNISNVNNVNVRQ